MSQKPLCLRRVCCSQQFCTHRISLSTGACCNHVGSRRRGHKSTRRWGTLGLEALPAKHRPSLCRLKRHRRLNAACRTFRPCLCPRNTCSRRTRTCLHTGACAFRLARFAPLRIVLKLFVEEKKLFPSGENELTATICTSKEPIDKFHAVSPVLPKRGNIKDLIT